MIHICLECGSQFKYKKDLTRHTRSHNSKNTFSCTQCDKSFSRKDHLNKHLHMHSFKCRICTLTFTTQLELQTHNKIHLTCEKCGKIFNTKSNLDRHLITHDKEKPFSCTECDHNFSQKVHLEKHLMTHSFKCNECNDSFFTQLELQTHSRGHLTCEKCGRIFNTKSNLVRHLITHDKEKPFSCTECDHNFSRKDHLEKHLMTHSFKCTHCAMHFDSELQMQKHLKEHFHCNDCGTLFLSANLLYRHKESNACGNSFTCDQCGSKFSQKNTLRNHLKTHYLDCNICGHKFDNKFNLQRHYKTHTNKNDLCCLECGEKFQRRTPYKRHLKDHTQKIHNLCQKCDSSFSRKDNLRRHMQSHSTSMKFRCTYCYESFKTNSLLTQHLKCHDIFQKNADDTGMDISGQHSELLGHIFPKENHFKALTFENGGTNLCYMNSIINSILNCQSFQHLINANVNCKLISEMKYSINVKKNEHYSTENIRNFIVQENNYRLFANNRQSDPQELMTCFFDISQPFENLFLFNTINSLKCNKCHENSDANEVPSKGLIEPINNKISLSEIIKENRNENVDSECHKCKNETKTKNETFITLPDIFMVTLKRGLSQSTKDDSIVIPEREITLNNSRYILRSVVEHIGNSIYEGHYTASCLQQNGEWIKYDDTIYHRNSVSPERGYIFFYEKHRAIEYRSNINVSNYREDASKINNSKTENIYCCTFCKMTFLIEVELLEHEKTHNRENNFICHFCDQTFSTSINLDSHLKIHNTQCDKIFSNRSDMLNHSVTHNVDELHKCRLCDLSFNSKEDLNSHATTHIGRDVFQCNTCDNAFGSDSQLKSHMKTHTSENTYKCTKCNKSYKYKKTLTLHLKKHTGQDKNPCILCDKTFASNQSLTRHMMTHKLENPYKCIICNQSFNNKAVFLKHKRTHTYTCNYCNKKCALKSTLLNHLKSHEPYKCNICDKQFKNKKVLESHFKTHTGEKRYKCNICVKGFSSNNNLMRHLKTHGEENAVYQDTKQDSLKRKRSEMFNEIKLGNKFQCLFAKSDILDSGALFKKHLREDSLGPTCIICKESWFNAFKHTTSLMCDRCNKEKPKANEYYTFSEENNMIPGPIPDELNILNNIEEASIKLIKPFLHIYKRRGGGVGFKGNCISFAQNIENFTKRLPYSVKDLPIILIQESNTCERKFNANAQNIRNALIWLINNNPHYEHITIDEEALKEYPENGGELIGIRTMVDPSKASSGEAEQSVNVDEGSLQDQVNYEEEGDMPRTEGIVFETLKRPQVSNMVQNRLTDKFVETVDWPERGSLPEKEFNHGWFGKAFPKIFPYGRGDITCVGLGKNVSFSNWVKHILKAERRAAKDPLFVMAVTNIMQRQQALTLSNIYAEKRLSNLTAKEFKENLEKGDTSVLKGVYGFSKSLKGTQQFFSSQSSISYNFIRHLRISSDDKEMFNVFLTFSLADLHEDALHQKLPNSHEYLNKKVYTNINELPPDTDMSTVIQAQKDHYLRSKAINENIDIVNEYFINKMDLLWKYVLKPIFGGTNYIRRYEFQHRGSIHCHMIMSVKNGPSCIDMDLAKEELPNIEECLSEDELAAATERTEKIKEARLKMTQFTSYTMGISAIHPEVKPYEWPPPHGQNIYKPAENVLRTNFESIKDDHEKVYKFYTYLLNRCMLHNCKPGYCYDPKKVKNQKSKGPDGQEVIKKKTPCRFNHPMEFCGFEYGVDENRKLDYVRPKLDKDNNLEINGSMYDEGLIKLLRNHPDLVTHIPELLTIWGANTDQKVITSYPQTLNYLLKYIMKPETQSDFFTSVAKSVIEKLDDEAPVRKSIQKILLNSVGQRDMSVNECMLICHNKLYVEYSKTPRVVNLTGSNIVKDNISVNDEGIISKDNWQESYWQRDSFPEYQQLCKDFPNINYPKHPSNISLREFVVNFTKKWKYSPANVFPHFIPSYKYVVHKGRPHYEEYCKNLLLMDKPGCTLENVGKEYSSCEAELKDFVENSEFCPGEVKIQFNQSQRVVSESTKETHFEGDAFDELYLEADKSSENAPKEDWMECFSLGFTDNDEEEHLVANDDEASNYDDILLGDSHKNYDWQSDRKELGLTSSEIKEAEGWIKQQKISSTLKEEQCVIKPSTLNPQQEKAYNFITSWIDNMVTNPKETEPIYLNISGRAGCGKTYFLNCVSHYATKKGGSNFLLKAAPTGTAAFLIRGNTLHSTFKLPLQVSTKKDLPDLSQEILAELQGIFQNCKILVIDEKSMVGLYMMYQIDKRLKEIKSNNSHLPFGGLSVIIMGDFAQLPPVGDKPMFTTEKSSLSHCQSFGKLLFDNFQKNNYF